MIFDEPMNFWVWSIRPRIVFTEQHLPRPTNLIYYLFKMNYLLEYVLKGIYKYSDSGFILKPNNKRIVVIIVWWYDLEKLMNLGRIIFECKYIQIWRENLRVCDKINSRTCLSSLAWVLFTQLDWFHQNMSGNEDRTFTKTNHHHSTHTHSF